MPPTSVELPGVPELPVGVHQPLGLRLLHGLGYAGVHPQALADLQWHSLKPQDTKSDGQHMALATPCFTRRPAVTCSCSWGKHNSQCCGSRGKHTVQCSGSQQMRTE